MNLNSIKDKIKNIKKEDRKNTKEKKERMSTKKLISILIVFSIVAVVVESSITLFVLKADLKNSTDLFLSQIERILINNEEAEKEKYEELKETYIIAAKAAAYMIADKPERQRSFTELKNMTTLLNVDEIHIFDANGTIIAGTNPEYYGYSFDSGEQMAYFKPMLSDKSLSMCQDVTPNTAEGKSMMYAITWDRNGKYMIQIGVEPIRLLDMFEDHEIENVIDSIPITKGYDVYVIDVEKDMVVTSTNPRIMDSYTSEGMLDAFKEKTLKNKNKIYLFNQKLLYANYKLVGNYGIVVTYDISYSNNSLLTSAMILLAYLLMGGGALIGAIRGSHELEDRKNEAILSQYRILSSMADIYYSVYLIDLVNDTSEEYKSQGEVKKLMDKTTEATEMMRMVMKNVTSEEHVEKALEFTELTTLAERLGKRKIITSEFVGKHIGWFESSFIVVEKDESGKPSKVIYTTRSIDIIKKKEEKLIIKSNSDELTGLFNRHAYEESLVELEKNKSGDELIVVSMDVNGLKTVNDSLGHKAGDELIVGASECMKRAFSQYGKVYRVGGDEFVALLSADVNQLQSILKVLDSSTKRWSGKLVNSLSVSYGYVSKKENPNTSVHNMVVLADKKMYEAKSLYYKEKGIDRRGLNSKVEE